MRIASTGGSIALFLLLLLHNGYSTASENYAVEAVASYQPLPRAAIPQSYAIKLIPEIVEDNLIHHGEVNIGVKVLEKTANLTLQSQNLCIDKNFTNLVDAIGVIHKPKNHTLRDNRFLIIEFEHPLDVGIYSLNLKFASNTTFNSTISVLRNTENVEKGWTIFTEAAVSRSVVFPCWDEPDLTAIFNLSIRHFSNYTVVSNMPVRHSYLDDDGNKWTNFEVTPPLSTSLVFFVISNLQCIRSGNAVISICDTKPNFNFSRDLSERTLEFMVKSMGFKTNLTKIDLFAIPYCDCHTDLMSGPGLIIYRESVVAYEPFKDPIRTKVNVAWTVVSGFIHQWTGSLVPSRSEALKCAWVISGLSTYLKYYIVDKLHPDWRMMDVVRGILILNQEPGYLENYYMPREWDSLEGRSHKKTPMFRGEWGAAVFHMLSNIVSEDVFNAGIVKFLNENQYRTVTTDDLWDSIQSVYDAEKKESIDNLSIKQIMKTWTELPDYPLLNVTRDYETGKVMITQQSNIPDKTSDRWWVPINFATKSNFNFTKTTPTHWLKPGEETLVIDGIDKDDWIIVNVQMTGLYRVDYDETNWDRIAKYMNSEMYSNIHPLNRAQLLSDLYYMIRLGRHNITTFFELAKYLSREDDYIPWSHAARAVEKIRESILDDSVDAGISNFFLKHVDKLIGYFGFEDRSEYNLHKKYKPYYVSADYVTKKLNPVEEAPEEFIDDYSKGDDLRTTLYRVNVLEFVCSFGHSRCSELARSKLRANIENATANPIPVNLDLWVRCSGAAGNEDYLLSMATLNVNDTTYVSDLGCSPNKTILWKYIEGVLAGEIKADDCPLYTALNGVVRTFPNARNRAQLHQMVFNGMKNFQRIYDYHQKRSIEYKFPRNVPLYTANFLKTYIYKIPTFDELMQVKDITSSNFPINMIPYVKEYINEQRKRIELSEKMSPIISEWLHEHT